MKFNIDKQNFINGLQNAQNVADRKSTMPIAANVLLKSVGDKIECSATNLMVSVKTFLIGDIEKEGGITASAKTIYDVVKSLPDDEDLSISFSTTESNFAQIDAGKVHFEILGMSDEDFPSFPDYEGADFHAVDSNLLADLLTKVYFSILPEETRPHLNAAYMEADGKVIRLVSTDGHRLSKAEAHVEEGLSLDEPILIPRRGVQEIRRILEGADGDVEIAVTDQYMFCKTENVLMAVRLNDEKFPPYGEVIPSDLDKKVVVERDSFIDALRRVSLLSAEKTKGIRIRLDSGKMDVLSRNPDVGEAREEIEVSFEGEEFIVAFNSRYFSELLSEMAGEEIILEFGEELDPCLVRPVETDEYIGVIMPLRF